MPVRYVRGGWLRRALQGGVDAFAVFGGSTLTSTIPGITVAGPSPEGTLYTPTLDLEYLVSGRPVTLDVVPVTPGGVPTPAIPARAALVLARPSPLLAVDAGVYHGLRVPHHRLPSARPGGRIDVEPGLPGGLAARLYCEARVLGETLGLAGGAVVLGETIPAGTTTAAAIMEALGFRALGRVASAGPSNPRELKERVVRAALARAGRAARDPLEAAGSVGDPVHVSMAGAAAGAVAAGARVVLAGGTQMGAVLAVLARLEPGVLERVGVVTTRWLAEDPHSDLPGLLDDIAPQAAFAYVDIDFSRSRHEGLRAYERGYVKEGVGMGAALALAVEAYGDERVLEAVDGEYERVVGTGAGEG